MGEKQTTTAERLILAGHKPRLDEDGEIDNFAVASDYHNGPMCSVCYESRCEHCDDGSPFKPCPGEEEMERRAKARRREQYEKLKAEFDPEPTP